MPYEDTKTTPESESNIESGQYDSTCNLLADVIKKEKEAFILAYTHISKDVWVNQYETLHREYLVLNSQFESGNKDSNGDEKYFHNIINHRNDHISKNIEIDTKDIYVGDKKGNGYWWSWIVRQKLLNWATRNDFGQFLNRSARYLPDHGSVVCRKSGGGKTDLKIELVDLRNLVWDPTVEFLKDSQLVIERFLRTPWDLQQNTSLDQTAVTALIESLNGKAPPPPFITADNETTLDSMEASGKSLIDAYFFCGYVKETQIPESYRMKPMFNIKNPDDSKYVYVHGIIGGIDANTPQVLFLKKGDKKRDFPYKEVHLGGFQGAWKRTSNTERLFSPQVRMNELVNRFFKALRIGSLHIYQTQGEAYAKNLLSDMIEGDIVETKELIVPIQTELRAFNQYQTEVRFIEQHADKLSNTSEIITGEALPAATPDALAMRLEQNAKKGLEFIREDFGLFVCEIMRDWVYPYIKKSFSEDDIIDVIGSPDDLARFTNAVRNSKVLSRLKEYVLNNRVLPSQAEIDEVTRILAENNDGKQKKLKYEGGILDKFNNDEIDLVWSVTDEAIDRQKQAATITNLLAIAQQNLEVFKNPLTMKLIAKLTELSGTMSPLEISDSFLTAPPEPTQPNPREMEQEGARPVGTNSATPSVQPGRASPARGATSPAPNSFAQTR